MKLPAWLKVSVPTKSQLKHDGYLTAVAFISTALSVWQAQPDRFSKAAVIASITAAIAAVVTLLKSIVTTI